MFRYGLWVRPFTVVLFALPVSLIALKIGYHFSYPLAKEFCLVAQWSEIIFG